jgi:hypothetical protein
MIRKVVYVEPADYIPKDLRKKYKLGEYADKNVKINEAVEMADSAVKSDESFEAEILDIEKET